MLADWSFMKRLAIVLGLLVLGESAQAKPMIWQPPEGIEQIALWPGAVPGAQPAPGPEDVSVSTALIAGQPVINVTNVINPTISVYPAKGKDTGAAVMVIPGGGFQVLAMDLEGTEVCDWLTAKGITCVLLKYRVPSAPYDWQCDCRPHNLNISKPSLQDLQRAMRLVRDHAQ